MGTREAELFLELGVSEERLRRLPRWAFDKLWVQHVKISHFRDRAQLGKHDVTSEIALWGLGPAVGAPVGYRHVRWLPEPVLIRGDDDIWPRTAIDVRKLEPLAGESMRLEVRRTGIGIGPILVEGSARNCLYVIARED